ncbi:MAG: divalent-cation tolerance protein CutA [Cyanobacteria bacterium P01_E01_bin.43]
MDLTEHGVILVTVDTQETAVAIAQSLVDDRLAACINLFPLHSVYTWNEQVQQAVEWQLVIKTDLGLFAAIEQALQMLHPYDVPEIIALPIVQGSTPYLAWLAASTAPLP